MSRSRHTPILLIPYINAKQGKINVVLGSFFRNCGCYVQRGLAMDA
jgi:hypothetical protein